MSPDQTQVLIRRVRQGFLLAGGVKVILLIGAAGAAGGMWRWLAPTADPRIDAYVLLGSVAAWAALSVAGNSVVRMIQAAAAYAAGGQVDVAERALVNAAKGFSLFRGHRLLAMQNLAGLAHGAGRFGQAAVLSRFVVDHLGHSRRLVKAFERPNRLLLADSEVMLGHLPAAESELSNLDQAAMSLPEQLVMLATRCYYDVSACQWDHLVEQAPRRARMAELMPAAQAATTLACLALGYQNQGGLAQRDWLWCEATLLMDRSELVARLPLLEPLPAAAAMPLPWCDEKAVSGEEE